MTQIIKRTPIAIKISLIGMTLLYVLILCNVEHLTELFGILVGIHIFGLIELNDKWGKEGRTHYKKIDSNYNKNLTRKTSDSLLWLAVAYTFVSAGIIVFLSFNPAQKADHSWYFSILMLSIVCALTALYWVDKTSKQVIEIEKSRLK